MAPGVSEELSVAQVESAHSAPNHAVAAAHGLRIARQPHPHQLQRISVSLLTTRNYIPVELR